MSFFEENNFTLIEWLSITGLAQSVMILVHIIFRTRDWRQVVLSVAYFSALGLAFALQFSLRMGEYEQEIRFALWICRSLGPPLCYLLVLQIAQGMNKLELRQFWMLVLVPLALLIAWVIRDTTHVCADDGWLCRGLFLWLYWLGSISGAIAMLALWGHKDLFSLLHKAKGGRERYWLVITLVVANVFLVAINFLRSTGGLTVMDADSLLVVMGLAMAYLVTTTLFRVYPPPLQLSAEPSRFKLQRMTDAEKNIAARVRTLMEVDKLYHEPTFSRADLAREMQISENTLSRVINVAFGKSFPVLLNEFRVEDAKRMLQDPDIPIQVVAFEVGFNSLASFNRAFREVTGDTPTRYRQDTSPTPHMLRGL